MPRWNEISAPDAMPSVRDYVRPLGKAHCRQTKAVMHFPTSRWRRPHKTIRAVSAGKYQYLWLLASALLNLLWISGIEAHTLRVRVQPGRGSGGEPFLEQPQVEILEGNGGDIDVFFEVRTQL